MSDYPTVNYIGNKEKISNWIVNNLPVKNGIVLDLFCGGCSVSYELKKQGFSVICNDALYSNYVLAKSIIENENVVLNKEDFINIEISSNLVDSKEKELSFLTNTVYFDYEVRELAKLCLMSNELTDYKKYLFLSLLRRAMIRKIPYSRMNVKWEEIKKFRDEIYSYKKYGRYRHYHNIPFMEHILLNLDEYNKAVFSNSKNCYALNCDALDCIRNLDNKVDIIYMDPPYPSTMNKYNDFYGYYDKMFNMDLKIKTDLTSKASFLNNFLNIIKECIGKTKYIAISLNNSCFPSCEALVESIREYIIAYEIFEKEHIYKVTGKKNKNKNIEILLICEMKG